MMLLLLVNNVFFLINILLLSVASSGPHLSNSFQSISAGVGFDASDTGKEA